MKYSDMLVKECTPRTSTLNISEYPHIKDSELFRVLRQLPKMTKYGPWVAGGAVWRTINNEPLDNCDIDIFFQSPQQFEQSVIKMGGLPLVNNVVKQTKNKWNTIYKYHIHEKKMFDKTYDVQFINMNFHPNIEALIDSFDFTVCQFVYDGENLVCGLSALEDLAAKRIRISNVAKPKSLFKHLYKYLGNGFTISSEQTKDLSFHIMNMNCWKKTDAPDYGDDEVKKDVNAKYISPVMSNGPGGWEGYPATTTTAAPVVEQEDEIEHTNMFGRVRGVRGGRNRRAAVDPVGVQPADVYRWGANLSVTTTNAWDTRADNSPIHNRPEDAVDQSQVVMREDEPEPQNNRINWEMPAANQQEGAIRARVLDQLVREDLDQVPVGADAGRHFDRVAGRAEQLIAEYRNQGVHNEVMNNALHGLEDVRQQANNNAAEALNNAFGNIRPNPPLTNIDVEQEIVNDAAMRAEVIEHGEEGLL